MYSEGRGIRPESETGQRSECVLDVEVDLDPKALWQVAFDPPGEIRRAADRRRRRMACRVREHRLLFVFLGDHRDQLMDHARVVIEILEVEVLRALSVALPASAAIAHDRSKGERTQAEGKHP